MTTTYVEWYRGSRDQSLTTPRAFFDRLHAEFSFTFDGAASANNALLPRYATEAIPANSWAGERVFCNPPWSGVPPFVELAASADLAVLLVPARTNCRWWHRALALGAAPRFFLGKLKFGGLANSSPVDCVLLIFRPFDGRSSDGLPF